METIKYLMMAVVGLWLIDTYLMIRVLGELRGIWDVLLFTHDDEREDKNNDN